MTHGTFLQISFFALVATGCGAARADNFAAVNFDARLDQLVVTMVYRGTNPDHEFTLSWGACRTFDDGRESEVTVQVLDSQARDPARKNFSKTTRLSLDDMPCRPARLTLRTEPRFLYTLRIPAQTAR